jgi:hypothetical protein
MGVEVDRDGDFLLEGADELCGCGGFAESCHILDGEDMGADAFEFLSEIHIVVEAVLGATRICDVAGVADGCFTNSPGLDHAFHRHTHVGEPVEAVEDAEHIDAGIRCFLHEDPNDVVRVVGVANGVGGPQKHLEEDIGNAFAKLNESLPGAFAEKSHGCIECGSAPHFDAEEFRAIAAR